MKPEDGAFGLFLLFGPAVAMGSGDKAQSEEDQRKLGLEDPVVHVKRRLAERAAALWPALKLQVVDAVVPADVPDAWRGAARRLRD